MQVKLTATSGETVVELVACWSWSRDADVPHVYVVALLSNFSLLGLELNIVVTDYDINNCFQVIH